MKNLNKLSKIADIMVNDSLHITSGDRLLLNFSVGGIELAKLVGQKAAALGAAVLPRCHEKNVEASILIGVNKKITPEIFTEMVAGENSDINWCTKVAYIRHIENPNVYDQVDPKILAQYHQSLYPSQKIRVERRQWSLIYLPSTAEAKRDKISFKKYEELFFKACSQPWDKIIKAQQILIDKYLDKGKTLEIFAGKSHLKMSIDKQVFENSTIECNIPGSEVFSSPVRHTLEGQLILPYPVMFSGKIIPNLKLYFEKGKVIRHETSDKKCQKFVEEQLNIDSGAREIGEIAFGTNRILKQPFLNGLFIEKVAGSGHLALGCAYQGKVDNGVRSTNHIDLTFMMNKKYGGGKVLVDGKIIQKNGKFIDKRLAILN